ncbi:MAG: HEAT repeat domain-containing protein [Flavobacteriaceae bacterium]
MLNLPKIHTDLLWYLTMISCGLGLIYFIFVFFIRNKLSKKSRMVAEKKKELAPMVSQFLFFEQTAPLEEKKDYLHTKVEIRELIKSDFNRLVLAEILLDLQKDVSGEARENLYELYKGLGLHHDAFEKLKSRRWEVISQGILELTQMRVEESYMFIRRFINHRRGVIRKQAQIATVTLKNEGIGYFLDTCKHQISEWQQLKLLDVLRNFDDFVPPRFKIWLTSKNKDVVLFALRLIRYYNQNDANQAIIQLIKHRNNQIKTEAVQCLKEFGVVEARDTIKESFRRSKAGIKIAMLDAIAEFGDRDDIEFLKKVERSDDNFTVRSKALSAINTLAPEKIMPTDDIKEPSSADLAFAQAPISEEKEANEVDPGLEAYDIVVEVEADGDDNEEDNNILQGESETTEGEQPEKTSMKMEEAIKIPELEVENEEIFDLCAKEEFSDILDEAKEEEDPQYLPLHFLPLVESEWEEEYREVVSPESPTEKTKPVDEEDKFKEDLNAILNRLAMKDESKKSKTSEEVPDFIPLVVESQIENQEADELIGPLEMEVIAETISTEIQNATIAAPTEPTPAKVDIRNTEVVAEEVSWQQLLAENEIDIQIDLDQEVEIEETHHQEFQGFSIFREMFREFDSESKLILLDEILVVGEYKELCFLATLSEDRDKRVRKKALKIRQELASKLGVSLDSTVTSLEKSVTTEKEPKELPDSKPKEATTKLPLEYCFFEGPLTTIDETQAVVSDLARPNGASQNEDQVAEG